MRTLSGIPAKSGRTRLAAVLGSATLAVIVAYALRMLLFILSNYGGGIYHLASKTAGLETGDLAFSIASGRGFSAPFPGYTAVTAWLAPVFPLLTAIGYKIFHLYPYGGFLFCQTMNCAFSAAICWPIHALGSKVFGQRVGLASAWLWVFLPYAVLMPLEWTWDQCLSALLLSVLVLFSYRLREPSSSSFWFGYGLLWAFSALVNPTLCAVLPFLLGWIAFERRRRGLPSIRLVAKALFIFVLALLPWTVRNYYALGGWVFVKSNLGLELWLGNNPSVKEDFSPQLNPMSNFRERIELLLNGEPNYNREKEREAFAFIESHPKRFLRLTLGRFVDTWAATYDSRVEPWIVALHLQKADVWFSSIFSILSLTGIILALKNRNAESLPLAICLMVLPIPYYLTHTSLRYRHPIDPMMTILTIYAISFLFHRGKAREKALDALSHEQDSHLLLQQTSFSQNG